MGKSLFIAEKPSVAEEFAKALKERMTRHDGYEESDNLVVTWCVGHLVRLSYPEAYDPALKRWSLDTLPFIPKEYRYEIIPDVKKQFHIVSSLLNRNDVDTIYVCTDSGREGEYIYRLVAQMADVKDKTQKRVWIDSQTEEEILRGIKTAKNESEYDNLAHAAYRRAEEDYLMGINFSRLLTLKYGNAVSSYLNEKHVTIAVGRVMTCVLGMVVRREREIRTFVKTPFYRVTAALSPGSNAPMKEGTADGTEEIAQTFDGEWRAVEGSEYFNSPLLYKENGFRKKEDAQALIEKMKKIDPQKAKVIRIERKTEKKNPPLLYNLAELQNDCSRMFHISPDQTLTIVQSLYEHKLTTYPRTDARVLSSAVAKVIRNNIAGLGKLGPVSSYINEILAGDAWKKIGSTRYTNDKAITDHYALIPTGQGMNETGKLNSTEYAVYLCIVRRFLSIFYPPAQYKKIALTVQIGKEQFFSNFRVLTEEGYLKAAQYKKPDLSENKDRAKNPENAEGADSSSENADSTAGASVNPQLLQALERLRSGSWLDVRGYRIRESETTPPKRYNSGTMILAMENAGSLIEDESLREQIRGAGIGTSATRADILKKLVNNRYIALNKKTQILTPTQLGEMIYDVVSCSIAPLLRPDLTASWEKGLNYVSDGSITPEEYMDKLTGFVIRRTNAVKELNNQGMLRQAFNSEAKYYKQWKPTSTWNNENHSSSKKGESNGKK